MKKTDIEKIAAELRASGESGGAIAPIRTRLADMDIDAAYKVQDANTQHGLKNGRRLIGRKIGLTAKKVQAQLGVDQCDFGMLFSDMLVDENDVIEAKRLIQPKVEAEIAFVLKNDLTQAGITSVDVMRAIDYAVPALEVVDSRIENWDIGIVDTIADNASCGVFVLGTDQADIKDVDLRLCGMTLECDGQAVSTGAGAACLGNPINAVVWLAQKMVEAGRPLMAGDIVLSGALGPMVAAKPGQAFEAHISGLGSVRTRFAA